MKSLVTLDDVEAISIGAGILGTGGGGDPYLESIQLRRELEHRGPQQLIDPKTLETTARMVVVGMIGAPTAGIEKLREGTEILRAVRLLETHLGQKFDAIVIAEIGGANSMGPLIAGLQAGIPTVDGDGMGRAFPELQMCSFLFQGDVMVAPLAMADAGVATAVIPETKTAIWCERLARNLATSMGATAGLAGMVMTGRQVKEYCVPYTVSLACRLGERVIQARGKNENVSEVIAGSRGGKVQLRGKIIDVKVLSRANNDELPPGVNKLVRLWVAQTRKVTEGDKMAGRHGNKGVIARILPEEDMPFLQDGTPIDIILNPIGVPSRMNLGQVLETHLGWAANALGFRAITPVFDGAPDRAIEDALAQAWLVEKSGAYDPRFSGESSGRKYDARVVRTWLEERGYKYDEIMANTDPGKPRKACMEIWLREEMGQDVTGLSDEEMMDDILRFNREDHTAAPVIGKAKLYDGRTGEEFDQPITVGYIYMMKLSHLVEDKIHARSTGPYSMITQQPLGGKAQFGGQRFGEMEVWALEAYSAAYNLQEVLTVKSDDVAGRVKTYEAIVKGEPIGQPGVPESFNVLLKELQSLGLSVELLHEEADRLALRSIPDVDDQEGLDTIDPLTMDPVPALQIVKDTGVRDIKSQDGDQETSSGVSSDTLPDQNPT